MAIKEKATLGNTSAAGWRKRDEILIISKDEHSLCHNQFNFLDLEAFSSKSKLT